MKKKFNAFLLIGIIGISVLGFQFAVHYGRAMWGNKDMWWTPMSLALPLHETTKYFKIFLSDELLQDHIKRGSLSATDQAEQSYQVVSKDIKIRLNNWNKIKASFLHSSVYSAFLLGVSATFLVLGIVQLLTKRKEKQGSKLSCLQQEK